MISNSLVVRIIIIVAFLLFLNVILPAQQNIAADQIVNAEKMYDLHFTSAKRDSMIDQLKTNFQYYRYIHSFNLPNSIPLPQWFDPVLPEMHFNTKQNKIYWNIPENVSMPKDSNALAFYSILQLASLITHKKITSVELTKFFISRLKQYGDTLHCVISLTEDIALQQAKKADDDLAKKIYKSPLQGIPYGLKDLFAVKGTKTTYGTPPFKDQVIDEDAFVYTQLEKAGAVLVAKLSMGELAMDDIWFGGQTKNPWNLKQGSNGSSAGSASATVAGLVPFSIGTETYGPICRNAEDAAIVYAYIHGADSMDRASRTMPFNYTGTINLLNLKVAYAKNYIDSLPANSSEKNVINVLQNAGVKITPIDFPSNLHTNDLLIAIWAAESAAAFDPLTRSGEDEKMV